MALPYIEVSHLASSSSFYASILQPLGLRYLSTSRDKSSSVGTVTYGFQAQGRRESLPILQIREASRPFEPLKHSFIVLGAASPTTVGDFHECAVVANPYQKLQSDPDGPPKGYTARHRLGIEGGVKPGRATVRDLDGNIIQVIPVPPNAQYDAGQVLEWDFDLASRSKHTRTRSQSHPLPSPAPSSESSHTKTQAPFQTQSRPQATSRSSHKSFGPGSSAPVSQRAPSHVSEEDESVEEPTLSPRQSASNGLSTGQFVGAILGVAAATAAGAALTYNMVTKDRDRKPRHEMEHPAAVARRSTYPEKAPSMYHKPHHDDHAPPYPGYPQKALPYRTAGPYEQPALPAPQPYVEELPFRQPGYQNDYSPRKLMYREEVTPNKFSFPDDYTPRKMPYDDDDDDDDSDEPPRHAHSRHAVEYLTEDPLQDNRSIATRSKARSTVRSTTGRSTVARSVAERSTAERSTVARSSTGRSSAGRSSAERSSAGRSTAKSTARSVARGSVMSRIPDEIEETRSRHSSRHSHVSGRSRSEAPTSRGSHFMGDGEHRSHVGSRHSVAPRSTYSRARSQRPDHDPERDSYFSTRSRRSSAGLRHPPPPHVETEVMAAPDVPDEPIYDDFEDYEHVPRGPGLVIRNRDGSKLSVSRLATGGEPPIIMSHQSIAPSHISARNVPIPMSGVGSSQADWDDDDVISLAPSDSISCVGSKASRRSRRGR